MWIFEHEAKSELSEFAIEPLFTEVEAENVCSLWNIKLEKLFKEIEMLGDVVNGFRIVKK